MIEARAILDGKLADKGCFSLLNAEIDRLLSAITDARGRGGHYEISVRWLDEDDCAVIEKQGRGQG